MNILRKKTTATLLIAIFMISMFAIAVSASTSTIELYDVNDGSAEWRKAEHDVKLYVADGSVDWAQVSIAVDIALEDITEMKFREYIGSYSSSGWKVQVVLGVDLNGNGVFDSDLATWHFTHTIDSLAGDSFVSLEQPSGGNPATGGWVLVDSLSETKCWEPTWTIAYLPFADFIAALPGASGISKTSVVKEVILQIGGSGSWMAETAYIDDVTINGFTYDFKTSSSTSLESVVRDPVISITVSPTNVDFGTIIRGHDSDPVQMTVTNIGETKVKITTDVNPEFYQDNLYLGGDLADSWSYEPLGIGSSVDRTLVLKVPQSATPIEYSGTLVFWAEEYIEP